MLKPFLICWILARFCKETQETSSLLTFLWIMSHGGGRTKVYKWRTDQRTGISVTQLSSHYLCTRIMKVEPMRGVKSHLAAETWRRLQFALSHMESDMVIYAFLTFSVQTSCGSDSFWCKRWNGFQFDGFHWLCAHSVPQFLSTCEIESTNCSHLNNFTVV